MANRKSGDMSSPREGHHAPSGHERAAQRERYRKASLSGPSTLDADEIVTLEELMEEDDTSLKREFHTLRILCGKAIEQLQSRSLLTGGDSFVGVISDIRRLADNVDKLSAIAERRARIQQIAPQKERVVRVEFNDPSVRYHVKEALRRMEDYTIRRVLAVVLLSLDPNGELGVAHKLPASFAPYLPPAGDSNPGPPKSVDELNP
jgi:hypothetical protein